MLRTGSRLDEADANCRWLVDPAFKSHPNNPVEYLDMHNYSSVSSDRIANPTVETSSSAWSGCFSSSDLDEKLLQRLAEDGDSTTDSFEAAHFVCVDVGLDSCEEPRKELKTVPKRQIQLKRCGTKESRTSTGGDIAAEASFKFRHPRNTCLRQNSFPATVWEASYKVEPLSVPIDRKQKLQKSHSLEETSSKTEMASSLIKSVLFKKMQHESTLQHLQFQEGSSNSAKVKNTSTDSSNTLVVRETPKATNLKLGSDLPLNNIVFSGQFPLKAEQDSIKMHGDFGCSTRKLKLQSKPTWEKTEKLESEEGTKEAGNRGAKPCGDLATACPESTTTVFAKASGGPTCITNRAEECPAGLGNHKQGVTGNTLVTEIPKISYKLSTAKENKNSFSKECLLSRQDVQTQVIPVLLSTEGAQVKGQRANNLVEQAVKKETNEGNQTKPIKHKVRDLRKLVKNTYNLNFGEPTGRDHTSRKQEDKPRNVTRDVRQIPADKKRLFTLPGERGLDRGASSIRLFLKGYQEHQMAQAPNVTSPSPQIGGPSLITSAPAVLPQCRTATALPRRYHTLPPQPSVAEAPDLLQPRRHSLHSLDSSQPVPKQPVQSQLGILHSDSGSGAVSGGISSPNATATESLPQHLSKPHNGKGSGLARLRPEGGANTAFKQNPRRVLLDPETGKYFYLNVPLQPLCKVLFDPETGQYVQVQIPQQGAPYSACTPAYPIFSYQSLYTPCFFPYATGFFSASILAPQQP